MGERITLCLLLVLTIWACTTDAPLENPAVKFKQKDNAKTGIVFSNELSYNKDFNVYKYRNFYNGGGVALGDINNDGLTDIYLTSNQDSNRLFLNKGDWEFQDITSTSGVAGTRAWSTGVTTVDINADGFLDIYICNSGDVKGDNKVNELFINNGDNTFSEQAEKYGLADKGFSTHASFFDYDKDGDLDVYLLNNSFQAIGSFNLKRNERPIRDELGGDKLMENREGVFVDVSSEAGIYGSVIGFGLGVTVGDVNNDGWEDIFVSNDFFERDYLYVNQQDGTFKEDLVDQMKSISGASMGADIGDIDNDGDNDIFVTEMLPSDYERLKTVTTFEDWDKYQYNVKNGYHHQFTRNTLHLNRGNNSFSEVSRLAGVEASDWSWGALFFDMDNDGLKDLFIANGIYKDLTNQDYLQYVASESVIQSIISEKGVDYKRLIDIIPSNPVPNQAYLNKGNLQFERLPEAGLDLPSFSNGAAYGDLDNDGDLDLIVNNVGAPCFVLENKNTQNNYLKFKLTGEGQNTFAIGAKIKIQGANETWMIENQPTRGFQSSMDPTLVCGLGKETTVDLTVYWPDGSVTEEKRVEVNQTLSYNQIDASEKGSAEEKDIAMVFESQELPAIKHEEKNFVDFNRERLVYQGHSTQGPRVAMADFNGDDRIDLALPGAKGMATSVVTGINEKSKVLTTIINVSSEPEYQNAHAFDVDGDGDQDLYLASGGVEITPFSALLNDVIAINDGAGNFTETKQVFQSGAQKLSTLAIDSGDIDGDGDLDLFVGERIKVGKYGAKCSGYILLNDGKGNFEDVSDKYCRELTDIGMITDARLVDLNQDNKIDLVLVGEFMEPMVFENQGQEFNLKPLSSKYSGWWNRLHVEDLNGDGLPDLVLGNLGLNSRFEASEDQPLRLYFNDFDQNGFPEGVLCLSAEDGKDYPFALRHNLTHQLKYLKKKYPDFESFKQASMDQIFDESQIANSSILEAVELRSMILMNQGNLSFEKKELPKEVQFSPIYAIESHDVDKDGDLDLLMGGNLHMVQPEIGIYDASYGHCLINDGDGNFEDRSVELGFHVNGEIRDIQVVQDLIYVFRNNDSALVFKSIDE